MISVLVRVTSNSVIVICNNEVFIKYKGKMTRRNIRSEEDIIKILRVYPEIRNVIKEMFKLAGFNVPET